MHGRRCTPANDAYSLDSVSMFYQSLRRKSRKRASNKSLKSYLNQGFDDPVCFKMEIFASYDLEILFFFRMDQLIP